ncbi:MAG: hypothetical protein DDT42_01297 [candidate division WS2 bacterium]|uniref:Uncharacterized protein n=1 Tax=Psychracetigena formicireducens TaxID=2986056 RepID=A0A9E2BH13_PSYF1|nr:hypothetical protein [Candidatus Psychracetigena formicireducens]
MPVNTNSRLTGVSAALYTNHTWASRPAASAENAGTIIRVTDVGPGGVGALFISDATVWRPVNGQASLARWSVPVGVPSSGSIANNGALTLTTALDRVYSDGIYLRFPANAIAAGVPAGLYYCVMSSTTVGTIFNNSSLGIPSIPASPVPFSTTGPGAYVQTTGTDIILITLPIPGGLLGSNGSLANTHTLVLNATSNSIVYRQRYANYGFAEFYPNLMSLIVGTTEFVNTSTTAQKSMSTVFTGIGGSSGTVQSQNLGAVNSSINQDYTQLVTLTLATDWLIIQSGNIKLRN